ncbi:MAG: hypothetical protein KC543_06835 [Myxococcales bacterium]|nr:hypothetical protein [Myxococcales bacterium]
MVSKAQRFARPEAHGPIEEVVDGVYWVRSRFRMAPGVRISRNMTIVADGGALTLVNPVRLSAIGERALAKLGTVAHVVKLGYFHDVDDAYTLDRFGAPYWALPEGTRRDFPPATETLRPDHLPLRDATLFAFEDTRKPEAALRIDRGGGVLITCDSLQHWPDTAGCSLPAKVATRRMGFLKRRATIGPPWHTAMRPKEGTLERDFRRLLDLPFEHLIGAHGAPLRGGARDAVAETVAATFG